MPLNCTLRNGWNSKLYTAEPMCMHAQSLSRVWLSATPWTVAHQAFLSLGFSRQEYWSELPFPPPEDLPNQGIEPESPALAGGFFTTAPPNTHIYILPLIPIIFLKQIAFFFTKYFIMNMWILFWWGLIVYNDYTPLCVQPFIFPRINPYLRILIGGGCWEGSFSM